jgi:delta 1-pyrroline-5-carboxylate dehydrogenase
MRFLLRPVNARLSWALRLALLLQCSPVSSYVHEKIYESFTKKLTHAIKQLNVGNGLEKDMQIGPLINQAAIKKVEKHIADALQKGAELLCGRKIHTLGASESLCSRKISAVVPPKFVRITRLLLGRDRPASDTHESLGIRARVR